MNSIFGSICGLFLALNFMISACVYAAPVESPNPSGTPNTSPNPKACQDNPNYKGDWTPLCINACPPLTQKNANGTVTRIEQTCIFGIPPGSKAKKSECHCEPKPKQPPKKPKS